MLDHVVDTRLTLFFTFSLTSRVSPESPLSPPWTLDSRLVYLKQYSSDSLSSILVCLARVPSSLPTLCCRTIQRLSEPPSRCVHRPQVNRRPSLFFLGSRALSRNPTALQLTVQ